MAICSSFSSHISRDSTDGGWWSWWSGGFCRVCCSLLIICCGGGMERARAYRRMYATTTKGTKNAMVNRHRVYTRVLLAATYGRWISSTRAIATKKALRKKSRRTTNQEIRTAAQVMRTEGISKAMCSSCQYSQLQATVRRSHSGARPAQLSARRLSSVARTRETGPVRATRWWLGQQAAAE